METGKTDAVRDAEELRVRDDLLKQLHEANARLHAARQAMEQTMDDSEPDHAKRVDVTSHELGEAERAVEEINAKIHDSLKPGNSRGNAE
jgi:predicted methyltransferase